MVKSSKGFTYRGSERSVEDVNRRSKQQSGLYDSVIQEGFATYKAKEGENTIRILPPTWEDTEKYGNNWEVQIYQHYGIGPDGGSFLCLDKMLGQPCPICEARRSAVDDDERYQLAPSLRALAWVVDRADEKAGPQLWGMPIKKVFRVINARSIDRKGGGLILIDDPEEGYDISFFREGTDKHTDYTGLEVLRDPTPLHDNQKVQDKWLAYITENSIPDVLLFQDADYIEKVMSGRAAPKRKPGEEDDEEGEATTSRRPAARRRPAEEEETGGRRVNRAEVARRRPVEPPEEEEVTEDEGEATRPAPRRRPAAVEDDMDAETGELTARRPAARRAAPPPEDDEGEAPPPRRTAAAARKPAVEEEVTEEEEGDETPAPSRVARKGLERLRPTGRR